MHGVGPLQIIIHALIIYNRNYPVQTLARSSGALLMVRLIGRHTHAPLPLNFIRPRVCTHPNEVDRWIACAPIWMDLWPA